MKENQANKKKYIMIFLIAFAIPIVYQVFKHFSIFKPSTSILYDGTKELMIDKTFSNNGCYEIGFWSGDKALNYHITDGKFDIWYYHDGKLIKKVTASKDRQAGYSMKTGSSSFIILDTFQIPLKDKYSNLNVKFKTIKKDTKIATKDDIYLYIGKSDLSCGKKRDLFRVRKNYPITKAETNNTLQPLFKALISKDATQVKEIVDSGISPDVIMIGGRRPIHYASFLNDTKTLQYLINEKVDLNRKDLLEKTPLHYAIEKNATKTVKLLLDNGADFSLVHKVEDTYFNNFPNSSPNNLLVLRFLIKINLIEMTEILLEAGLNPNNISKTSKATPYGNLYRNTRYRDYKNEAPYKYGKSDHNYTKMIRILKSYGAKTYDELQQEQNITKGIK